MPLLKIWNREVGDAELFWSPNWDKGPWFCSEDCATNSYNAKQAKKYWEKHSQKTIISLLFWIVLAMIIIGGTVYTIGYLNAGIQ